MPARYEQSELKTIIIHKKRSIKYNIGSSITIILALSEFQSLEYGSLRYLGQRGQSQVCLVVTELAILKQL